MKNARPMLRRIVTITGAIMALTGLAAGRPSSAAPTLEPIEQYTDWLDARPETIALRGKVVIVDIFTFGCYNCQNVTPNLKKLYRDDRAAGLVVVGVHTPETPYETNRANVVANIATQGIVWPVAIDNAHTLWNAYATEYWPTQLIFDRHGVLRKTVVGDSQDALVDHVIAKLLAER